MQIVIEKHLLNLSFYRSPETKPAKQHNGLNSKNLNLFITRSSFSSREHKYFFSWNRAEKMTLFQNWNPLCCISV